MKIPCVSYLQLVVGLTVLVWQASALPMDQPVASRTIRGSTSNIAPSTQPPSSIASLRIQSTTSMPVTTTAPTGNMTNVLTADEDINAGTREEFRTEGQGEEHLHWRRGLIAVPTGAVDDVAKIPSGTGSFIGQQGGDVLQDGFNEDDPDQRRIYFIVAGVTFGIAILACSCEKQRSQDGQAETQ